MSISYPEIIKFIRQKDYKFVKELGQGACGKTILIHDTTIDENFVCKKYAPVTGEYHAELFQNFIREIKLLYQVYHKNIVRIYNYHLLPEHGTGYIIMEHVDGDNIDSYAECNPDRINELFIQTIDGFRHLEVNGILHRDIRPHNIIIHNNGTVKIIDLGFGKHVKAPKDFDKSISLNWWCDLPFEFQADIYNFSTEVYFVGKLFERILSENRIKSFKYNEILTKMCQRNPNDRVNGFIEVDKIMAGNKFIEIEFSTTEIDAYQSFSELLASLIIKIEHNSTYIDNHETIIVKIEDTYKNAMLEKNLPNAAQIARCFINGTYYHKRTDFPVRIIKDFLMVIKEVSPEKQRIIMRNIKTKLDSIERYSNIDFDDVPF